MAGRMGLMGLVALGILLPGLLPRLGAGAASAPQTAEDRSTREGVYTATQAQRGDKVYQARCINCHMSDQFTGFVFMQSWEGQRADALYDLIRKTMPQDNPGGLKPQDYADLLAYIFQKNRLPAGASELKGTKTALKQVVIESPDK